jgi:hypothetical protein
MRYLWGRYNGSWRDGQPDGKGTLMLADGNILLSGYFQAGSFTGNITADQLAGQLTISYQELAHEIDFLMPKMLTYFSLLPIYIIFKKSISLCEMPHIIFVIVHLQPQYVFRKQIQSLFFVLISLKFLVIRTTIFGMISENVETVGT